MVQNDQVTPLGDGSSALLCSALPIPAAFTSRLAQLSSVPPGALGSQDIEPFSFSAGWWFRAVEEYLAILLCFLGSWVLSGFVNHFI